MSKYTFTGDFRNCDIVHAFRIYLKGEPTFEEIQQMINELYGQLYRSPEYLFMNEEDHQELSVDIKRNHHHFWMWQMIEGAYNHSSHRIPGPRGLVSVYPVWELDRRTVIAGFMER